MKKRSKSGIGLAPALLAAGLALGLPAAAIETLDNTTQERSSDMQNKTIGDIVAADFRTAAVFSKHGIDFCCGGKVPFAEACRSKGLDPVVLAQELAAAQATPVERTQNYGAWTPSFLADYIVNVHHAYLHENTGMILAYCHKIAQVHGSHHPEVAKIDALFARVAEDLERHLADEEKVFFPALKRVEAARQAGTPPAPADLETVRKELAQLGHEHDAVGEALHEIRRLSSNYTLPADACNTFKVTYQKLQEFEDDLHKHVHLENNILFPKVGKSLAGS